MKSATRHTLFFGILLLLCSLSRAQSFGPFSLTASQCLTVDVGQKGTATYQVLGSWTGTIQPKVSVAGQPAVNGQTTPAASTTPQSTITGNGAFFTPVSGYSSFILCGATITNTATVYVNVSSAAR